VLLPLSSVLPDSHTAGAVDLHKGQGRILFVDDERSLVNLGTLMLEGLGYTVDAYCDPKQALQQFKAHPNQYDLVITDVTMPHVPGDQLGQLIKDIRSDIPIVLCSGYTDRLDYEAALEAGFAEFVAKPLTYARLSNVVQAALLKSKRKKK
jgi:CheY-like chemotaxis protein